ncbi:histidine kinase [uncultured Pontibacter sp.]|uniref:sensor histidine kinase n=1 Tax=uncultured Pontibacter sp. TaxID=453356 RepID=UPI00261175A0|nr:histidine kinase [uncultured Pontibacter sp.]
MSPLRVLLVYLGWAILWSAVHAVLLWLVGVGLSIAITDALLTNLLLVSGGYAMGTGLRYYQPSIKQGAYLFGWSMGMAGICILLFDYLIGKILKGESSYLAFVDATLPVRMVFAWLMVLLMVLLSWMWYYTQNRQLEESRKSATDKLAREAELYSLRQQLQPHFLFNSLNSISALVGARPEQARTMIHQLSDFLRGTLRKEDQQLVTLEEELKHLDLYLEIEKVRFGHRLQTALQVQDETVSMRLPALLLQPIVENAIKFGLYDTIGETAISIKASAEDNYLQLQVQNPYDPDTARPNRGTGFGLSSVQRRLYLLYARQDLLKTQQKDHTFITTIKIPQNYE